MSYRGSGIRVNIVATMLEEAIFEYVSHDQGERSPEGSVKKSNVGDGVKHLGSYLNHSINIPFESNGSARNRTLYLWQ